MIPGTVVAGFYELPIHIAVAHEVLGSSRQTQIGDIPAQILVPGPFQAGLTIQQFPRRFQESPAISSEAISTGLSPSRASTPKTGRRACGALELS